MSNAAEVAGLQKLARLSPEQIRSLYLRSGTLSGGLRGALLGGALGYFTGDRDDPEAMLKRIAGAALAGGGLGAFAGRLHGHHLAQDPFKRVTDSEGGKLLYLRKPGEFSDELIHAAYPAGHSAAGTSAVPTGTYDRPATAAESAVGRVYKPEVGSALLDALLKSKSVPREARL